MSPFLLYIDGFESLNKMQHLLNVSRKGNHFLSVLESPAVMSLHCLCETRLSL